ncbi:MAG: HDOD domain-containing protein [Bryobacteraceae bacterium]|jgi:HD-like signal output (HDOD) protein
MTKPETRAARLAPEAYGTPWALRNLPPFPGVAIQVLQILSREDVHVSEIGKLISVEPVFAADVLQVANSALFGLRSRVMTVSHAVVVLGLERVKGVTLTRAFGTYLMPVLGVEALQRCWQNSLAGALLAEKLARSCGMNPDIAYTAALLRDIGRLALLVNYPGPYANMLAVAQENGYDLMDVERNLFDIDHCQAGCWLMDSMALPAELREVVAGHHAQPGDEPFGLVRLVRIADLMSDALGFGILMSSTAPDFTDVLPELPEAARARFPFDPDELRTEIASKIQILSQSQDLSQNKS